MSNDAIKWAIENLGESFGYEYFEKSRAAKDAAQHMTTLERMINSPRQWEVKEGPSLHNQKAFWVIRKEAV